MTKESTEEFPKSKISMLTPSHKQIINNDIDLGDLPKLLMQKLSPLVFSLFKNTSSCLSKYFSVISSLATEFSLTFEDKIRIIVKKIANHVEKSGFEYQELDLNIDRKSILFSAIQSLMTLTGPEFALKLLEITFIDESGIDNGLRIFF
jgi:hypothetical protein